MTEGVMLEVSGLRAGYGPVEVLRGIDLTVGSSEIVAVLGANGAGKSTLNNNLSGLFRPFAGRLHFLEEDITAAAPDAIVAAGLIQVPEGRRVFPNLSVMENLELGSYRRGRARRAGRRPHRAPRRRSWPRSQCPAPSRRRPNSRSSPRPAPR